MIKYILPFLLFLSISIQELNAQTYVSFPTAQDSVAWKMTEWSWGRKFESYTYISDDTIIDGKTYSKVYTGNFLFENDSNRLTYLIREENKQIFSKSLNTNNEYLLYDFTLNVNDTMVIDTTGILQRAVVTNIDSMQLEDGIFRKRFHLTPLNIMYDPVLHVEGFGSLGNGFSLPFGLGGIVDYGISTNCIFSSSELFYKRQNAVNEDCLELIIEVGIEEVDGYGLNVFPNPANEFIYFSEKIAKSNIAIYSLLGQKVFELLDFSGTQLDISSFKKGIYFLKIEGVEKGFVKIVKE